MKIVKLASNVLSCGKLDLSKEMIINKKMYMNDREKR